MQTVNEKSTLIVTGTFTDENGSPVTPSSGTYRIDDLGSGSAIKASTPFSPTGSTYDFVVSSTENAMVSSTNAQELHALTVTFVYSGKTGTAEYRFIVQNLFGVT